MILYFLRHGHAEDGVDINDFDRELTDYGRERLKTAASVMSRLDLNVSAVYTSPRIRALQTAEIVAPALGQTVEVREELNFGFNGAALKAMLADAAPAGNALLVGHEPTFSSTVRALTGAMIEMKKGGLVRVDLYSAAASHGTLVWLIAPKVFDALGAT